MAVTHTEVNTTVITHLSYVSNHTFRLGHFIQTPKPESEEYKNIKDSIESPDKMFSQNESLKIPTKHNNPWDKNIVTTHRPTRIYCTKELIDNALH